MVVSPTLALFPVGGGTGKLVVAPEKLLLATL